MSAKNFVDTNVLIYAHDTAELVKHERAKLLLRGLWNDRSGVLSPQILQEFYVNVTRKIARPLAKGKARAVVEAYAPWCVSIGHDDVARAFQIEDEAQIGFWDALVVAAAAKAGADRILSEDFNDGQRIAGVTIENPFVQRKEKS